MYETQQAQAQRLAELRFTVLDTVNASPYTTPAERATAALRVANCQNPDVLIKWYCNVLTLLAARELAPVAYATGTQQQAIVALLNHPKVSRQQKTNVLLHINRLTEQQAIELIAKLQAQTGATAPAAKPAKKAARQLTLPHLSAYAPKATHPTVAPTSPADLATAAQFVPSAGLTVADFMTGSPIAWASCRPAVTPYARDPRTGRLRPAQSGEFISFALNNN